jgi:hypothetical protein
MGYVSAERLKIPEAGGSSLSRRFGPRPSLFDAVENRRPFEPACSRLAERARSVTSGARDGSRDQPNAGASDEQEVDGRGEVLHRARGY